MLFSAELSVRQNCRPGISSEVVTGQVDVRNVKIPAYETENDITESEDVLDEEACDEGMEEQEDANGREYSIPWK